MTSGPARYVNATAEIRKMLAENYDAGTYPDGYWAGRRDGWREAEARILDDLRENARTSGPIGRPYIEFIIDRIERGAHYTNEAGDTTATAVRKADADSLSHDTAQGKNDGATMPDQRLRHDPAKPIRPDTESFAADSKAYRCLACAYEFWSSSPRCPSCRCDRVETGGE